MTIVTSESFVDLLEFFDNQVKTLEGVLFGIVPNNLEKGESSPFCQVILLFCLRVKPFLRFVDHLIETQVVKVLSKVPEVVVVGGVSQHRREHILKLIFANPGDSALFEENSRLVFEHFIMLGSKLVLGVDIQLAETHQRSRNTGTFSNCSFYPVGLTKSYKLWYLSMAHLVDSGGVLDTGKAVISTCDTVLRYTHYRNPTCGKGSRFLSRPGRTCRWDHLPMKYLAVCACCQFKH